MSRMDELNKQIDEIHEEQRLIRENCKHTGERRDYSTEPFRDPNTNRLVMFVDCMECRVMQLEDRGECV